MKTAFMASRSAFEQTIGATLPERWPEFPQAFREGPETKDLQSISPWPGYLFILQEQPRLIGNGGFVSSPDKCGQVEIGYEIAPNYRNLGYATEAAQALIRLAFIQGARTVLAHTLDEDNASNAVLAKLGMLLEAKLSHSILGTVRRYRITRSAPCFSAPPPPNCARESF
jgi:RimJ/RimL family protein N-acetyltransferase